MAVAEILDYPVERRGPRTWKAWTPAQENILRAMLDAGRSQADIARALGRTECSVHARRIALGLAPKKSPRWTPAEEQRLIDMLEAHRSYEQIARSLGRSVQAVVIRAKHLGICFTRANGYTMTAVSRLMGTDNHAVLWWARQGWLRARRTQQRQGAHRMWIASHDNLLRFLADERYWHLWEPGRIADLALREWTAEQRRGLTFLTVGEVGRIVCVSPYTVSNWVRKGWIEAVRRGPNWVVRSDRVRYPEYAERRGRPKAPAFTAEDAAFVREWWGRIPATEISVQIGRKPSSGIYALAKRLGLQAVGRGHWRQQRAAERGN